MRRRANLVSPVVRRKRHPYARLQSGDCLSKAPPVSVEECMSKDKTYAAPLFVKVRFIVKETGEVREQDVFMGDFPLMTDSGTFVINGTERVVVTQLVRSPGAYIMEPKDASKQVLTASLMPSRGSWLEFEVETKGYVSVRIDRKRKLPVTIENAESLVNGLFFDAKRYDLSEVGRYKVNKKLKLEVDLDVRTLTIEDIQALLKRLIATSSEVAEEEEFGRINYERIRHKLDEYEHFGNRRLRTVGELVQEAFRIGMY